MKSLIIFIFLLTSFYSYSLTHQEGIIQKITLETDKSVIADLYTELSISVQYSDTTKAIEYANKAIEFAIESKSYVTHVKAVANLGITYCYKGEHLTARNISLQAVELAGKHNSKVGMVIALENMGKCAKEINDFETALDYYNQALKITLNENIQDKSALVPVYGNMAGLYALLKRWDLAIDYYLKIEKVVEGDVLKMMIVYANLAYSYVNNGDFSVGENYARKLLVIAELKNSQPFIAHANSMLGERYYLDFLKNGNDKYLIQAEEFFKLALNILRNFDKNINYSSNLVYSGRVLLDLNNFQKSSEFLQESLLVSTQLKYKPDIVKSHYYLAKNYLHQNIYDKSLSHLESYKKLSEEIYNDNLSQKVSLMMVKFDTKSKEQEIINTKLQNESLKKDAKITFYITVIIILAALSIIILLYIVNYNRKKQAQLFQHLSLTDSLTALKNRRAIEDDIQNEIERYKRNNVGFTLAIGDIDYFKRFNDNYGHVCGDLVLKHIAQIIQTSIRSVDVVARWGGEEFLFMFVGTELKDSHLITEKLRNIIEQSLFHWNEEELKITMSFGLCQFDESKNLEDCIKKADDALYSAKSKGRNCVVLSSTK